MIVLPCPEQIRMARAALSWSQDMLADKSGLSVETIKRVEHGSNTTVENLTAIAAAFAAFTVTFEPYDADAFNDTGPIVRMRMRFVDGVDPRKFVGSKGQ